VSDFLKLTDEDDGKLFRVRVLNTGEMRVRCGLPAITALPSASGRSSSRALPIRITRTIIDAGCMKAGARRLSAAFAMIRLDLTRHYRSSAMPH
jgi:hypothetical protein